MRGSQHLVLEAVDVPLGMLVAAWPYEVDSIRYFQFEHFAEVALEMRPVTLRCAPVHGHRFDASCQQRVQHRAGELEHDQGRGCFVAR